MLMVRSGQGSSRIMPLSALDAFEDHFAICFVLFYKETQNPALLQSSLATLLQHYPLLGGRLKGGGLALNDAGVPFEVRHSNESLSGWQDPDRDHVARFASLVNPQMPGRSLQALMKVRLTQLAGGGSVLGLGFAHVLTDGMGFTRLFADWGKIARGETIRAACWDREVLARAFHAEAPDLSAVPIHAQSYLGMEELSRRRLLRLYKNVITHMPRMRGLTIRLRGEQLAGLKDRVNQGQDLKLSSHEILSAHLYKLFNELYNPIDERPSRFFMVADLRARTPGVPEEGVMAAMSGHLGHSMSTREIARADLYSLGSKIRETTRGIIPHQYLKQDAWLAEKRRKGTMYRVFACHDAFSPDFFISNCQYLPFYDLDFGSGRPYSFRRPTEKAPRIVEVFPAPDGDGCELFVNVSRSMARRLLLENSRGQLQLRPEIWQPNYGGLKLT